MSNIYADRMAEIIALLNPAGASQLEALNALLGSELPLLRAAVAADGAPDLTAGSSWPAAPVVGRLHWRTDLQLLCFYDGTRWMTAQEFTMVGTVTTAPQPYGADGNFIICSPPLDMALFVTRVHVYVNIFDTANTSNYWTVRLDRDGVVIWSAIHNQIGRANLVSNLNSTQTPTKYMAFSIVKTGNPGSLYLSPAFRYRLVIP